MQTSQDPRYSRLFELIRQTNQAEKTKTRLNRMSAINLDAEAITEFQRAAGRSLEARPQSHA